MHTPEATKEPSILVTQMEAARLLGGVGRTTLWRMLERGDLRRVTVGSRALVTRESIDSYVQRQTFSTASTPSK
jgi:excisionase family DNA binding protein